MLPFFGRSLCISLVLTLTFFPVLAQTEVSGQLSNGSYFSIAVPDGWTPADGLVIWNHGFDLAPPSPEPDLGPLMDHQLASGYAVAASSYSQAGWALFGTSVDLELLMEKFASDFGWPDSILVFGASLGALVAVQAVEQATFRDRIVGAFSICGSVGGSVNWSGALDLRLLYDTVCRDIPDALIPGGAEGLPFPPPPNFTEQSVADAVNACTGVLEVSGNRTADQAANLQRIESLTGLPEGFLLPAMNLATFGLSDLVHDPAKLGGRSSAIGNQDRDYGDADINSMIERVQADPFDKYDLERNYTPRGRVADTRIISLHTDKDGLVLLENESVFASIMPQGNLTTAVVVEEEGSHCGFTEAEIFAGWESLRGWVAGLPQPSPGALQATCEAVDLGGLAAGPCRISQDFELPELARGFAPRAPIPASNEALISQFGKGGGFSSDATFVNTSTSQSANVTIIASDPFGQPFDPGFLENGQYTLPRSTALERKLQLPPLGRVTLSAGREGQLQIGSLAAYSDQVLGGTVRFSIPGIGIAGVGAAGPFQRVIAPVRLEDPFNTGLAIRNAEVSRLKVELSLLDTSGEVIDQTSIILEPEGRSSLFVTEYFPGMISSGFRGSVLASAVNGSFSMIALELGDQPGQFTTLPVAEVP